MDIPRQAIEDAKQLVDQLNSIKHIHYRDLYQKIVHTNFQICTKVDFNEITSTYENIKEMWGRLKNSLEPITILKHKSSSGSSYIVTETGDVYRFSNHWGAVASCEWTLDGTGELMMSVFTTGPWQIGVANLKDFQIFRRKNDRRVDIILNPEWVRLIKVIIPLTETLGLIKNSEDFKSLPGPDKQLVGATHGKFHHILKESE